MRWLLIKDLQILRRSPLLVGLLIVYPIAIALMIGFALSSPPGKPKVAFFNEVPAGQGKIAIGNQSLNVAAYASELLNSIEPIKVKSEAEAVAKVRDGTALAAVIIPAALPRQIQSLITQGVGAPDRAGSISTPPTRSTSSSSTRRSPPASTRCRPMSPNACSRWPSTTCARSSTAARCRSSVRTSACSGCATPARSSRERSTRCRRKSDLRVALGQVVGFANLAIEGLGFASPVLGSIGSPLTVDETQLAGATTPTDAYAASIAVIVSLMFVTVLLAAGLLALERAENAYARLVRGLVTPGTAARREDRPRRWLRDGGHPGDGGARLAVRSPRLGAL